MKRAGAEELEEILEITSDFDRHAAEALYLEIRRLVKCYGADVVEVRIEKVGEEGT